MIVVFYAVEASSYSIFPTKAALPWHFFFLASFLNKLCILEWKKNKKKQKFVELLCCFLVVFFLFFFSVHIGSYDGEVNLLQQPQLEILDSACYLENIQTSVLSAQYCVLPWRFVKTFHFDFTFKTPLEWQNWCLSFLWGHFLYL